MTDLRRAKCEECGHDRALHTLRGNECALIPERPGGGYQDDPCGCTAIPTDAKCDSCGIGFVDPNAGRDTSRSICEQCWVEDAANEVSRSFRPLVNALAKRGVVTGTPENTGGGVMCLPIYLDTMYVRDGEHHTPYIYFSNHAEWLGMGLYVTDEGEVTLDPTDERFRPHRNDLQHGWEADGLADLMAEWVASILPAIRTWVSERTLTGEWVEASWHPKGRYLEVRDDISEDNLPTLPNTEVGYI